MLSTTKKRKPVSKETREKMRLAKIGKKRKTMTEATKKKISIGNMGKKHTDEAKEKMRRNYVGVLGKHWKVRDTSLMKKNNAHFWFGKTVATHPQLAKKKEEHSPRWVGNSITYGGVHQWLIRKYGNAKYCENLSCRNKVKTFVWVSFSGDNIRDKDDYLQLCRSCKYFFRKNKLDF